MPYNSETSQYERRAATVIDATPDGDTVAVAIDVKLDTAADDAVTDLNHHKTNGNHFPATSVASDSRYLDQSPAGVVSWKDGVVAANAALKDMSNVASGSIAPAKIAQDASNRFMTDAERSKVAALKTAAYLDILGAASQSGGVPTGSIIERGSNANGEYVRFADGTQICSHRANASASADVTVSFPATFISAPYVVTSANSSYTNAVVYTRLPTTGGVAIAGYAGNTAVRLDAAFSYLAIGRWF